MASRSLRPSPPSGFTGAPTTSGARRARRRMPLPARSGTRHPKLVGAIRRMEENLEEPVSRADLARAVKVSSRQLERLFRKYLGRTPTRFYLDLRLDKARQLLQQTDMTVLDV